MKDVKYSYLGVGTLTDSSLSSICTGGRTTIWFQGTKTVFLSGLNGDLWNCSVTAPPPLTSTSNLKYVCFQNYIQFHNEYMEFMAYLGICKIVFYKYRNLKYFIQTNMFFLLILHIFTPFC